MIVSYGGGHSPRSQSPHIRYVSPTLQRPQAAATETRTFAVAPKGFAHGAPGAHGAHGAQLSPRYPSPAQHGHGTFVQMLPGGQHMRAHQGPPPQAPAPGQHQAAGWRRVRAGDTEAAMVYRSITPNSVMANEGRKPSPAQRHYVTPEMQSNQRQMAQPRVTNTRMMPPGRRYVSPVPGGAAHASNHTQQTSASEIHGPVKGRQRHISPGSNPPSAHALSALRAALDHPANDHSNSKQTQPRIIPDQRYNAPELQRQQPNHQPMHQQQAHWSQSPQFKQHEPARGVQNMVAMRASFSGSPHHSAPALPEDIPLRYTMGGSQPQQADFQNASPRAYRSPAAPIAIRTNAQVRTEARPPQPGEGSRFHYPANEAESTAHQMAAAPHSTPTLAHAEPPSSQGGQQNAVDNGPIGIVFAHTSTPTAQGGGFTFNMHKITEVIPGTAAARCGLKADDTLIRVNDRLVDSMSESDLRFCFGQLWGTRSMSIEVLRTKPSAENPDTTQTDLERLVLTRVMRQDPTNAAGHSMASPLRLPGRNDAEDARHAQGGSYAPQSSPQMGAHVSPVPQNDAEPHEAVGPSTTFEIPQRYVRSHASPGRVRGDIPGTLQDGWADGNDHISNTRLDDERAPSFGGRVRSIDLPDPIIQEFRIGTRRSPVATIRKDVRIALHVSLRALSAFRPSCAYLPGD